MKNYFMIGIGGTGMSGLAQLLMHEGISVSGSDRGYDRGENLGLFDKLKKTGIKIYPQDGSGISRKIDKIIISRAIEGNNPDLTASKIINIPAAYRQEELRNIFRKGSGIAVSGTSGKSTVVGMIGCIFDVAGQDITVVNGGMIKNYINDKKIGNVHIGRLPYFCVETDESEGDLKGYHPDIGVITNIGHDHMHMEKLIDVYKEFAVQVKDTMVINKDIDSFITAYRWQDRLTFSIRKGSDIVADNIELHAFHSCFRVERHKIRLNTPGIHNIHNALAAVGIAKAWGISIKQIAEGLERFKGIHRRFDIVCNVNGIRVIDDYAHNPDKINAVLQTASLGNGRIIAVYQPHGYAPLKMFIKELSDVFADNLKKGDYLFVPDVYYAGGTVSKDISSIDLVRNIKNKNKSSKVEYIPNRNDIIKCIGKIAKMGDTVLVMGARDPTLHDFAAGIAESL